MSQKKKFIYKCCECKSEIVFDQEVKTDVICKKCSAPDWSSKCENCGETPVVPQSGMCGPCTFGEAETALGDW